MLRTHRPSRRYRPAQIAAALPKSRVLEAFNTTFANTLASGTVVADPHGADRR